MSIHPLWYGKHSLRWLLLPFAWGYRLLVWLRRWYLQIFRQKACPVPLIVVGNLTVGGVGKTPLVIALAKKLQQKGLRVGIVSRGYGASIQCFPHEVQSCDSAGEVGDEPFLIAQSTGSPVVISPRRTKAVDYLLERYAVQVIISDDGLQHYEMGRSIEIAVIDGMRGLGNGLCLPAGPLREPESRLKQVDFLVQNQGGWAHTYSLPPSYTRPFSMHLIPGKITKLSTQEKISLDWFRDKKVAAVAAIGNPERFYFTLSQLGIEFTAYTYPDHYSFRPNDLNYPERLIIMTEKDAVKCLSFLSDTLYYLPVEAQLDDAFWQALGTHHSLQGYC